MTNNLLDNLFSKSYIHFIKIQLKMLNSKHIKTHQVNALNILSNKVQEEVKISKLL